MVYTVELLTFLAVFLAIFLGNAVLYELWQRGRKRINKRLEEEMQLRQREMARDSRLFKDLHRMSVEFGREEDDFESPGFWARLETFVHQSGVRLTPRGLVVATLATGLPFGAAATVAAGSWVLGVAAALCTAPIPALIVQLKRQARMDKLRGQLPDTFDLMARVLRAGQTISQAMQGVASEFTPPIGREFGLCYEQQNLGLPTESALRDLARRTGLLEIKIFVLAMMVHRQTGGNLSELLEKLATIVRDRFRIRGLIKTLTAEGRLQAIVLLALPVLMFVAMFLLNREYALVLFQYPALPITTLVAMALGAVWIRRIISFDF